MGALPLGRDHETTRLLLLAAGPSGKVSILGGGRTVVCWSTRKLACWGIHPTPHPQWEEEAEL